MNVPTRIFMIAMVLLQAGGPTMTCADADTGTSLAPLAVREAVAPPTLDGILDEPMWRHATALTDGPLALRGVTHHRMLYLALTCSTTDVSGAHAAHLMRKVDDPELKNGAHVEVAVSDGSRTTIYRLLLTPSGARYDAKQSRDPQGHWTSDSEWSAFAAISHPSSTSGWSAEAAFPLTSGFVQCLARKNASHEDGTWHAVQPADPAPDASPIAGGNVLSDMTETQLITLANQQCNDPATLEMAEKMIALREHALTVLMNEELTDDQLKDQLLGLVGQGARLEGTADITVMKTFIIEQVEGQIPQLVQMRPMFTSMQPMIAKAADIDRTLMRAASLPAFLHTMREHYGDAGLDTLPLPGRPAMNVSMGFSQGGLAVGESIKNLPKKWDQLTEDQFQALRLFNLRKATPAGLEVIRRKGLDLVKSLNAK